MRSACVSAVRFAEEPGSEPVSVTSVTNSTLNADLHTSQIRGSVNFHVSPAMSHTTCACSSDHLGWSWKTTQSQVAMTVLDSVLAFDGGHNSADNAVDSCVDEAASGDAGASADDVNGGACVDEAACVEKGRSVDAGACVDKDAFVDDGA